MHDDETKRILQLFDLSQKEEKILHFSSDNGRSVGGYNSGRFAANDLFCATAKKNVFLQTLRKNVATRTGKELKEYSKEIKTSEERIERLDKIIESLYEDKVEGKISEERYLKMSDTYETEQAGLKERVKTLKSEIAKAKEDDDKILDFMMLIYKYNSFEELTPEILRAFIEKVVVHEKTKVDGHYRQTVEIFYNFVGAIDRPIWGNELSDDDD